MKNNSSNNSKFQKTFNLLNSNILLKTCKTRMWADAQRDGRPVKYR